METALGTKVDKNLASNYFIVFALKQIKVFHRDIIQVISSFLPTHTLEWDPDMNSEKRQILIEFSNNNMTLKNIGLWMNRSMVKEPIKYPEVVDVFFVLNHASNGTIFEIGLCSPEHYDNLVKFGDHSPARDEDHAFCYSFEGGNGFWMGMKDVISLVEYNAQLKIGSRRGSVGYRLGELVRIRIDMRNRKFSFFRADEFLTSVLIPTNWNEVKIYASFGDMRYEVRTTLVDLRFISC
jgi:hypothetical protein